MGKAQKFRDQTIEELNNQQQDLTREIYDLKNEFRMTRKMDKPHLIREKKKERARVLTILREKEGA